MGNTMKFGTLLFYRHDHIYTQLLNYTFFFQITSNHNVQQRYPGGKNTNKFNYCVFESTTEFITSIINLCNEV